ncbi:MAG: 8-oxoguanine deaminase [Paracoccus sp. (in: a-proteobacteria)]|uniref:8-oxoguanine deaminase n=2 Tax=Paracoccus TaxID=265 RepID=UPI000C60AD59|nr:MULTISPECIES: 8-oxoguanine deaminase [unclassified Paracoccus (in: a-proteobacteria)]MAN57473.1 8-oxoguanine deaminase [Paracoccus sp. (in: a-proteobacteria)]HIC64458.1 8-oxoguanine deaminase [Paracoccus sp. (in: a-proteobacteria)]|tara:strand:+ start:13504 stop:14856 length:1353 start_codon:yes stop_codon:yes gene_type:complete
MSPSIDRLLIRGADVVVTMDQSRSEIASGDVLIEDGRIVAVGRGLPPDRARVIEAAGCVVTPGLVNTHHHLFQTLTRAVPAAQDAALFGWLKTLYPIWARMGPDDIRLSAEIGLAELAMSGCTCSSDHLYMFPNGARLDDSIEAARKIGIRFTATRGAMSIGESRGGLPPDALVEDEAAILRDSERVIDAFHDPAEGAMVQVALAPCSPFSVSRELMRDAAILARDKAVRLHTHLAENDEDIRYSLATFGMLPGDYAESLGWTGEDVWHAHCVKLSAPEIDLFARTGTGVAHCPCSNARLASGIAPVRAMRDAGVAVGLGVDGSASNDCSHLGLEARQAMLVARLRDGPAAMGAREVLEIATIGGARVLGRRDIGALAPGMQADLVLWDIGDLPVAGHWDPVAALVFCAPVRPRAVYVQGRAIVGEHRLLSADPRELQGRAQAAVARLAG